MRSGWLSRLAVLLVVAVGCLAASETLANVGEEAAAASGFDLYGVFERADGDTYALDLVPRFTEGGRIECSADVMVRYRSRALRYSATVHPAFVERLERFEQVVTELAVQHYGRAPRRLQHRGGFACRSLRTRRERISEHALGNALDFQGLDFGPLPRRSIAPADMPRQLRSAFRVRVLEHWSPARARDAHHARFLHELADALAERSVFRGIVGPPRPRHHDHLHLDAAPWRYAWFSHE